MAETYAETYAETLRDIYFPEKPITTRTKEHVLLNALGGKYQVADLIDKTTNDVLGQGIDAALEESIAFARTPLNALAGNGSAPHPLKGLTLADGRRAEMLPGGGMYLPTIPEFTLDEQGGLRVGGQLHSMEELKRRSQRVLRKHGVSEQALVAGAVNRLEYLPRVETTFAGWTDDSLRCVAKMACNLFAARYRAMFMRPEFDSIRELVAVGGPPRCHVIANGSPVDIDIAADGGIIALGSVDHLLLLRGCRKTGRVEALVVLYKHLQYLVYLGTTSLAVLSDDIALSYRVDQLGRTDRIGDAADLVLTVPDFARGDAALAEIGPVLQQAYAALMQFVGSTSMRQWSDQIVKAAVAKWLADHDPGPVFTEEYLGDLARYVAGRLTEEHWRSRQAVTSGQSLVV